MNRPRHLQIVCGLMMLAHWAGAQSQTPPVASSATSSEGRAGGRAGDPYRPAKPGDIVQVIEPKEDNSSTIFNISLKWEVYSLPMVEAQKFLTSFKTDAERYAEIVKRAEGGAAVLEELQMLRTRSGQRAKVEAIAEKRYPTKFQPPYQPAERPQVMVANPAYAPADRKANASAPDPFVVPPASKGSHGNALPYPCPTTFETRNAGATLEVEPVLGADGVTIDVTAAPELVRFLGSEPQTPDQSVMQPRFQTQKSTLSITMKSGQTFLLGTQSPSHLSGVEGANTEKVVWLSFLTADAIAVE